MTGISELYLVIPDEKMWDVRMPMSRQVADCIYVDVLYDGIALCITKTTTVYDISLHITYSTRLHIREVYEVSKEPDVHYEVLQ